MRQTGHRIGPSEDVIATGSLPTTVIIGAGPAGLSAGYELARHGAKSTILEKSSEVGGLSRTAQYKGYCFDIGGHRFFTRVSQVQKMWQEILGDDFIRRPRLSRIYYKSTFFQYPIEPLNAFRGLGFLESTLCGLSYVGAQLRPPKTENNLEEWLTARFGDRLYRTFFKTYTEKVWGIPCTEIQADWAAQRIKGLSVWAVLQNAMRRSVGATNGGPKTLIQEFDYPRKGPGMMWNRARDIVVERGSTVQYGAPVDRILWEPGGVTAIEAGGQLYKADHFISSMPVRELLDKLDPAPPEPVKRAAGDFRYRDFLTVALIIRGKNLFPDQWIYVHDPHVKVGRIQNYNNWSPEMVPDPETTCLGLEYFCFEGDHLWEKDDADLFEQAKREVAALGLVDPDTVIDGTVLRQEKAYPVYDDRYQLALKQVRDFLRLVPNLQLIGRNGMHRYNNQDHSMLTGVLSARNILGMGPFDLWAVNADSDYHEDGFRLTKEEVEQLEKTQPMYPASVAQVR